jgi:hypothetical protein
MGRDPSMRLSTTTQRLLKFPVPLARSTPGTYRPSSWGKARVRARTARGNVIELKVHRRVPKRCSVVWQCCLSCRRRIHKNDPHYQQKKCGRCLEDLRSQAPLEPAPRDVPAQAQPRRRGARPAPSTGLVARALRSFLHAVTWSSSRRPAPAVESVRLCFISSGRKPEPEAPP